MSSWSAHALGDEKRDRALADRQELIVTQSPNRLLAFLPPDVFAAIHARSKIVEMKSADVLAEAGSKVEHVYFPYSGVISLVVELKVGEMIETAMVGHNGVWNASAALDGRTSFNKGIVRIAGSAAVIDVDDLRAIADRFTQLRSLLIRHDQVLFVTAQQSAACNASHSVEARMCRWLLRMRELSNGDDLILTQEFIARMLGVHRPSVSIVANTLQKAGLIKYSRGNIRLVDVDGLKRGACECYATVTGYYERMLSF